MNNKENFNLKVLFGSVINDSGSLQDNVLVEVKNSNLFIDRKDFRVEEDHILCTLGINEKETVRKQFDAKNILIENGDIIVKNENDHRITLSFHRRDPVPFSFTQYRNELYEYQLSLLVKEQNEIQKKIEELKLSYTSEQNVNQQKNKE